MEKLGRQSGNGSWRILPLRTHMNLATTTQHTPLTLLRTKKGDGAGSQPVRLMSDITYLCHVRQVSVKRRGCRIVGL